MSMDMLYENPNGSLEGVFNASNFNMICFIDYMAKKFDQHVRILNDIIKEKEEQIEGTDDLQEKEWCIKEQTDAQSRLLYMTSGQLAWNLLKEGKKSSLYGLAVGLPMVEVTDNYQYYVSQILHEAVKVLMFHGNPDIWVA